MVKTVFFIVSGIILFLFATFSYFAPVIVGYSLYDLNDFCTFNVSALPIGFEQGCGQVESIVFVILSMGIFGTFLTVIGSELSGKKKPKKTQQVPMKPEENESTQESIRPESAIGKSEENF